MRSRTLAVGAGLLILVAGAAFGHAGPGKHSTPFYAGQTIDVGHVDVWNNGKDHGSKFIVQIFLHEDQPWLLSEVQIYVGPGPLPGKNGNPKLGHFPFKHELEEPSRVHTIAIDMAEDLGFEWGPPSSELRVQTVAVHADVVQLNDRGKVIEEEGAWAFGTPFEGSQWGWSFTYEVTHPMRGHLIDGPVKGVRYETPTHFGIIADQGGYPFFPGETVDFSIADFYLGTAPAGRKVFPTDFWIGAETSDPEVIDVARLLQTLDADGLHGAGEIVILPEIANCFAGVADDLGLDHTLFGRGDGSIDLLLAQTVAECSGISGVTLEVVGDDDARQNLEAGISASGIFRKNVSKTEALASGKGKLEVMPVYVPARKADGSPSLCADSLTEGVSYQEWQLDDGTACDPRDTEACELVEVECRPIAKPLVVTYTDRVDQSATGMRPASDIFTAVSRDDGATWKRMNVSRMADLSSFDLGTGEVFPGDSRVPQMRIVDNKILAVWVSTYCRGGQPRFAIEVCDPEDPDYTTCLVEDDPNDDVFFVEDLWGVSGSQGSVDYDEVDGVEELGIGEIPYSCLWSARGVIVTQQDLDLGRFATLDDPATPEVEPVLGDVVWFKPERLTSGRRDAYIPVVSGTRGAGFSIAWQEDPEGLRPGKGKGSGIGWSGAIANHKTDVWYSWIRWEAFDTVDELFVPGGDPDDGRPGLGRPKALVPFSLPVRVSDNDMVNTDNLKVEIDGAGFPVVADGTFVPVDPLSVEHGNAGGTRRYAYLAKDDPLYGYAAGQLDLCETTGENEDLTALPGTAAHERWFRFTNTDGDEKLVCITADGRLLNGDTGASRVNLKLQPYARADGTKSAWVMLAYEETKGLGEPHADDSGDGQTPKPPKQDYGKNVVYHSFDFERPDLVSAGHVVNLPALCGGMYVGMDGVACEDAELGQPIPVFYDDENGDPTEQFAQMKTEVARRVRFLSQSKGKMGAERTVALVIFKQGQVGQGRPADVFGRQIVVPVTDGPYDNPFRFENLQCEIPLEATWPGLFTCPADGVSGYDCNVWGEATGDPLCGGAADPYAARFRDHANLTSTTPLLEVDVGPDEYDDPDDPDDSDAIVYGGSKMLLWEQGVANLGDESFDNVHTTAKGHRGFIRGDTIVFGFSWTPNWASARNGRDRYNFYLRRSFDGGQTWTTTPAGLGGSGAAFCPEFRTDPVTKEPPAGVDPDCVAWCAPDDANCVVTGTEVPPGAFEPARNVSELGNNHETVLDPRIASTPPVPPLDGRQGHLPVLRLTEDYYDNAVFFVAWGTGENFTSTGGTTDTPEAPPLDLYFTRSADWGDTYFRTPWNVNPQGNSTNLDQGELVWRVDWFAHGDPEEQGEMQLRSTPDGSKLYGIYHQLLGEDPDLVVHGAGFGPTLDLKSGSAWLYEESWEDDIWLRRVIFPDVE